MADKDSWWKDTVVNKKSDTDTQPDKENIFLTSRTVLNNAIPPKNKDFDPRHVEYDELPIDNIKNLKKDNK
ncbi:hypothetical protein NST32_05415 [Bacillus sp. FSL L8-0215]|uniref:hypothetical protein n=1 Tax=Bacillus sp. FSL L8-0215 TaxID=2954617 RepID=UPI003159063B